MEASVRPRLKGLVLWPEGAQNRPLRAVLDEAADQSGTSLRHLRVGSRRLANDRSLFEADLILIPAPSGAPPLFELGVAYGAGKPIVSLLERTLVSEQEALSSAFERTLVVEWSPEGYEWLRDSLVDLFQKVAANPEQFAGRPNGPTPPINLEELAPREFENLIFELLNQMGFRSVDWSHGSDEIDLLAGLPKTDPDGFRYEELWVCSIGVRAPASSLVERAARDPDFVRSIANSYAVDYNRATRGPITVLAVAHPEIVSAGELDFMLEHAQQRYDGDSRVRVRVWDPSTLVALIRQHPQLAFKYFGGEKSGAQHRRNLEQAYEDNISLSVRLQDTVEQLRRERDLRIRAEREAVWKDVAFTAAHKIGNPLFALETELQVLGGRIGPEQDHEALRELLADMCQLIERAKNIIVQFKSLTAARTYEIRPFDVVPVIRDALRVAEATGVATNIRSKDESVRVLADPIRLAECFDELVRNSIRWMGESKAGRIEVEIGVRVGDGDEGGLRDSAQIVFSDNGPGVSEEDKARIFVPFFTRDLDEGSGLGLALVQRMLEEQNGTIVERGDQRGARFELSVPVPSTLERGEELAAA